MTPLTINTCVTLFVLILASCTCLAGIVLVIERLLDYTAEDDLEEIEFGDKEDDDDD
jgi:hypothetical protein